MRPLADVHLHLEGCIPVETLGAIARRHGHRFSDPAVFEAKRRAVSDSEGFLALYAEVCRALVAPADYAEATRAALRSLAASDLAYVEVYVSPGIWERFGRSVEGTWRAVIAAAEEVFEEGTLEGGLLLDVVRQFGPEAAHRVLDLHEQLRSLRVVGFGMGGQEGSLPAKVFSGVYERARRLALKTSVHVGEWAGADSVWEALDHLRPDRIDHGIAAAEDAELLRQLAADGIVLSVAPTSNVKTGVVPSLARHPLPRLLEAQVAVALSADDPVLFGVSTQEEYRRCREVFGLGEKTLRALAANAWRAAFCTEEVRERGLAKLYSTV